MSATPETLGEYFEKYGWAFRQTGESGFVTWFRGDVSTFRISVNVTKDWVYFSISPFVVVPKEPECERKLHKHLLLLNHEMNMAKFTIDEEGDVILTVEFPSENLDYSEFSDALGVLSYHADDTYAKVFVLAHVPEAQSVSEDKEDLEWGAG